MILVVGSGGMEGKGFGGGSVYILEKYIDFIFVIIVEEGGFIVVVLVVFLFLLLLYWIIIIGYFVDNLFGILLCVGLIGILIV